MDNNIKPDNKDIPVNSSDQYLSPNEIGDLPTPEELAEWAANFDESESIGCFLGNKTFETAQAKLQAQEQFDRKPLEVKLFNMGFTTDEIASMSDEELKENVKANMNQQGEYLFEEPPKEQVLTISSGKVEDSSPRLILKDDCYPEDIEYPEPHEESIDSSNAEFIELSDISENLPCGIIESQIPDSSVLSAELGSERVSVIVLPNKASARHASRGYPEQCLIDSVANDIFKAAKVQMEGHVKLFAVPETTETLCNLLDRSNIDFFLLILDFDILQGEASYREAVSTMYDAYTRHPKDRRCIITSDADAFSDPNMKNEKRYILKGGNAIKRKPEIISCRNITYALKKSIESIRRPKEIAVIYNSVQQSRIAILNLKENYQNECGIMCSEASKDEAGEFYIDKDQGQREKRITFYTGQNTVPHADNPIVLITVSDASRGSTTLSVRQIINVREAVGDNTELSRDIIIHNTFYCHPKDWEASFSSFIEKGSRIALLQNATEELAKDDKALARFFRPIRRTVQYKVGIKGRFQQISLLRQDAAKVWKPSYMSIDSLLIRTRMLEKLYSSPLMLSEALKEYYPELIFCRIEDEPTGPQDDQKKIEKSERKKSLDRVADSRNRELDRILDFYRDNKLTDKTISSESTRGRSSKRKIWREFQRIYPYLPTEEAICHLKKIKSGNRIGFKNLNNSIMFWALDDEHPLKQSVCSVFRAGERYTGREIKERMSPIVKYHFNRDYLAEDTDKKDTGRKLITLFKSFMNAERPRNEYIVPVKEEYHTHKDRIAKDDNDLMRYFML